jgi:hypothetical protein
MDAAMRTRRARNLTFRVFQRRSLIAASRGTEDPAQLAYERRGSLVALDDELYPAIPLAAHDRCVARHRIRFTHAMSADSIIIDSRSLKNSDNRFSLTQRQLLVVRFCPDLATRNRSEWIAWWAAVPIWRAEPAASGAAPYPLAGPAKPLE